jgi:LysR family transcriptional regulator, glycine cleavage system transcriptional activator
MLTSMPQSHRLPLQLLPTFCAVARAPTLRAAAEALHLTHSAISQQIRLLEDQLGTPLFERRGRRLLLNAAGEALLEAAEPALARLHQGAAAARAAGGLSAQTLRLSAIPSFAQRWLLPRMARWRALHPAIVLELHTSQQTVDLVRDGFDAALRQGQGPWKGLRAERLFDSPLVVVGAPATAARLQGRGIEALAEEPLLGDAALWGRWFALAGLNVAPRPVASFNDAGLMLQAAEQGLGLTLGRDLLVADALREGRLCQIAPPALVDDAVLPLWLVYPTALADSPGIVALRDWLQDELESSRRWLTERAAAGPTGSRSRAPSAPRTRGRG